MSETAWIRKDTEVIIRNTKDWKDDTFYEIRMATPSPEGKVTFFMDQKTYIMTPFPNLTGTTTVGGISEDFVADIVSGITSWLNTMDIYIRLQQADRWGNSLGEAVLLCFVNPTIGEPWFSVQKTNSTYNNDYSLAENQDVYIADALYRGASLHVTRNGDSDVKNWKVDIGCNERL